MGEHSDRPESPEANALPARNTAKVAVFDGRGGVRPIDELGENPPSVPQRGFLLVAGSAASPAFVAWLNQAIGVHDAAALTASNNRSRCTVLDDKALVVLRVVRPGSDGNEIGRQFLALSIEKGRVIVVSDLDVPEFLGIAQWKASKHAPVTAPDLVARLALRAADRIEPQIERLGDNLDNIEEMLMRDQTKDTRQRLARLRRNLISFRRLIWPQRDVLTTLEIEDLSFFTARDRTRLREAAGRLDRLGDELQALSERAVLVHEHILDTRAEQMNRAMLILAAVTVVLLPLTVISGMLGMNLGGIPFADSPYAFAVVAVLLVFLGIGLALWMRRRKWL